VINILYTIKQGETLFIHNMALSEAHEILVLAFDAVVDAVAPVLSLFSFRFSPNVLLVLRYSFTTPEISPLSCFSFLRYVNRALLALFCALCTISMPATNGLYNLIQDSVAIRVTVFRNKIPVSTPLLRMFMQTPANGSPLRNRTKSTSPTRTLSGFDFEKRRVREPDGSNTLI
jgi:hypothetical protein